MRISQTHFLASILILGSSYGAYAVQRSTNINLNVTHIEILKFIGSAPNINKIFSVADIKPVGGVRPTVTIGTLGLESNIPGNCTLTFSTFHNFRLKHTVSNKRLTGYRLEYRNKRITKKKNKVMTVPCDYAPSDLDFRTKGPFRQNVKAGFYSDTITIIVTSP